MAARKTETIIRKNLENKKKANRITNASDPNRKTTLKSNPYLERPTHYDMNENASGGFSINRDEDEQY
jgi:hypothetical protein